MRVPLVAHVRDEPQLDDLTRRLLGKTNLVLAISHFIAGSLGEIPGTRIEVLYNAVDVAGIAVTAPASDPVRPLRLVTPAAFRRDKRIELLLDCAKLLSDSGCRFHWRICGPRPDAAYSADVEARHSELALEDCVSLEPSREHEELYRDANLVVSGSLREPFGRTVIEGHARGLPVVGFASGALPEVVEEGVTGLLVSDGDAAALAGAIASLESDRSRIVEMGRAGRAAAKRRFSLESLLDALETHHDSVA
jgi:glycosyltransferase involved in cell wall biosynthesis